MHDVAWSLLFEYLEEEYQLRADCITVDRTPNGKPFLSSHPHIHFSIAHSNGCVACAVSDAPIGIDLERIRPISARIKKRMRYLPELTDDTLAVSRFTELESYVKLIGGKLFGMGYDEMKKTADKTCRFIDCSHLVGEEYKLTLCIRTENEKTEAFPAPLSEVASDPL